MKIHELKSAKALLKAALQALFESSSFEVMTGLIEKDYDIKKFKQMTLGDFTKDEVVPSKKVGAHFTVTVHPAALKPERVKTTFNNITKQISEALSHVH
jgi:hypothetical protein|tara:strand:- start:2994 stop:3290 length:297 start_codon:yes stop_codon:yes gene_type:complete